MLARLPVLQTWWCLDDWGQLLRASGTVSAEPGLPARWLSRHFYWTMTWPLFGMSAAAHAVLRLLLHGLAAATLVRLARRLGLGPEPGLVAGLLLAASPIAFTPLYWASGIQELLAGVLAILAVERWLARGRAAAWTAGACMVISILAKESGLGLPVLFLLMHLTSRNDSGHRPVRWTVIVIGLVAATGEALLVARQFATGPDDPYRLGGFVTVIGNLGMFGRWLGTPGPTFAGQPTWSEVAGGLVLFALWWTAGVLAWRRGRRLLLGTVVAASFSLAPALSMFQQAKPYMAYGAAAALALAIGSVLPARRLERRIVVVALVVAALAWGATTTQLRIRTLDDHGRPADPVVRAALLVRETVASIATAAGDAPIIIFQQPLRDEDLEIAERDGPRRLRDSDRVVALGGETGLARALGRLDVTWRSSLLETSPDAEVFAETAVRLEAWGPCPEALLRAAVIDIYVGHGRRAMSELARASALGVGPGRPGFDPVGPDIQRDFLLDVQMNRQASWLIGEVTDGGITMKEYLEARELLDRLAETIATD
ncbi:MAG: DUF2029 domain-containing protein [bacterium]|nr:DUF2029 domain-containing protein [bacterium]